MVPVIVASSHPPFDLAFEDAVKTIERWSLAEPTDEEKLAFLRQAIVDLGEPENIEVLKATLTDLGDRAYQTDDAFDRVASTLNAFAGENGDPLGIQKFQAEWNDYRRVRCCSYSFFVVLIKTFLELGWL